METFPDIKSYKNIISFKFVQILSKLSKQNSTLFAYINNND